MPNDEQKEKTMAIEDLIPGVSQVKLIITGVVLAAVVGVGLTVYFQHKTIKGLRADITTLETNNATLKQNTDILRTNYLTCSTANQANAATIEALKAERQDALDSLAALAKDQSKSATKIDQLNRLLDNLRADPDNNGSVAPVLRETIRAIQEGDTP